MSTDVITEPDLGGIGQLLGQGAQGAVYLLPNLSMPDVRGQLVYKKFRRPVLNANGLTRLIAVRQRLTPSSRSEWDRLTTWPLHMVTTEQGIPVGIVMRIIPEAFMHSVSSPSRQVLRTSRSAQFLMIPTERLAELGLPEISPQCRLAVCREFANGLNLLHRVNVVFGDISPRNVLFSLLRKPRVLMLDRDGMRVVGEMPAIPQLDTPDWQPPEGSPASLGTDRYKLGLFVLRVLSPGGFASTSRDPDAAGGALDPIGMRLLHRALSADPTARATAAEWTGYLDKRLDETPSDAPALRSQP